MEAKPVYLACPHRPGQPRVGQAVCRACRRNRRCLAWRAFISPPLFPDLFRLGPTGRA